MPSLRQANAAHPGALRRLREGLRRRPARHGQRAATTGEAGRFRNFTREEIAARGDNLDIAWLKDEGASSSTDVGDPDNIAAEIQTTLKTAMDEINALRRLLAGDAE